MSDWFFWIIGRIYLGLKYKNWYIARKVRDQLYAGSFSAAGRVVFLRMIGLLGAIFLGLVLIAMIIGVIWKLITHGVGGLTV